MFTNPAALEKARAHHDSARRSRFSQSGENFATLPVAIMSIMLFGRMDDAEFFQLANVSEPAAVSIEERGILLTSNLMVLLQASYHMCECPILNAEHFCARHYIKTQHLQLKIDVPVVRVELESIKIGNGCPFAISIRFKNMAQMQASIGIIGA
ncbi:hypothetical protein A0J57_23490 [Sphingobium sp. 22B]|nr:hypothetical protein AXW74_22190 [Sphingobium sp. AM]KYC29882.1 hypothetical protein A0J57_23490 [Sphingobium sp. 22B]OAP31565.1 hypothetical protein A8O16_13300 [Sphingobium sp. 20006FA]